MFYRDIVDFSVFNRKYKPYFKKSPAIVLTKIAHMVWFFALWIDLFLLAYKIFAWNFIPFTYTLFLVIDNIVLLAISLAAVVVTLIDLIRRKTDVVFYLISFVLMVGILCVCGYFVARILLFDGLYTAILMLALNALSYVFVCLPSLFVTRQVSDYAYATKDYSSAMNTHCKKLETLFNITHIWSIVWSLIVAIFVTVVFIVPLAKGTNFDELIATLDTKITNLLAGYGLSVPGGSFVGSLTTTIKNLKKVKNTHAQKLKEVTGGFGGNNRGAIQTTVSRAIKHFHDRI